MLTLGINTATNINSVTLFSDEVLAEKTWSAQQNEAETLLPTIKKLLAESYKSWEDLTRILLIHGPGAFTSLRVGVITANSLAYSLDIPIYTATTFSYYRQRLPQDSQAELFVSAGKALAYFQDEKTPKTLEEVNQIIKSEKIEKIYGNILPQQAEQLSAQTLNKEDLLSFGEAFLNYQFTDPQKQVEPLYIQPAKITMSKKITG